MKKKNAYFLVLPIEDREEIKELSRKTGISMKRAFINGAKLYLNEYVKLTNTLAERETAK